MIKKKLQKIHVQPRNLTRAMQLMLVTALCIALLNTFSKQLMTYLPLSIAAFFRMFLPLLIMIPFIHKFSLGLTKQWRLHILRGFIVAVYIYAWFFYLQRATIFDATLLFSTGPLFTPFLSRIFLHRPLRIKLFLSTILGFIGVVIIMKPDSGVFQWAILVGLFSGFGNAASQICLHKLTENQHPAEIMFNVYFWSSAFFLLPILYSILVNHTTFVWHTKIILVFIPIIIISLLNQSFRAKAYQYVRNPASIMPLIYLAIPLAALFDWILYKNVPSWNGMLGALIIILSIILISTLKPKEKKIE